MIEITHKDLLARITRFRTKTGLIETPVFLPVVHPTRVLISPRRMFEEFGCKTIITNAYLLSKAGTKDRVHDILDFPGSIMTDSGAYQLLIYGDVQVSPNQIIEFQEKIESDIAVILDVPTGGQATYDEAKETVKETLHRAEESVSQRTNPDILWVGPIQGGTFPDLVIKSAQEIAKLDFQLYAIGSPTQLMEQYQFDKLVDLIMAAKQNIPVDKPVHLFGAGHPLIFPLIVALGCDMFDSAAYVLFARHDRILSSEGTYRLEELHEDFCTCPTCSKFTISEIKQLKKNERVQVLAEHNLRICQQEITRIKHAIREGRLWRLVESRISSHPALVNAMRRVISYHQQIEKFSPVTKKRALFITSQWSLYQPEIIRHQNRMNLYSPPESKRDVLLLFSSPRNRPYHTAIEFERFRKQFHHVDSSKFNRVDTVFLSPFFGLVPLELTSFYPLAQNEIPHSSFFENHKLIINQLQQYTTHNSQYNFFFGVFDQTAYWKTFARKCRLMFKRLKKRCIIVHTAFTKQEVKKAALKFANEIANLQL